MATRPPRLARRHRARRREGHPHALGARQGPARAAGPSAGLLPDRARARARRRPGDRRARPSARGGRGGAAGAFRRGRGHRRRADRAEGDGTRGPPGDAGAGADGATGWCWCSTATCRCCAARRWRSWSGPPAATAAWRWSPPRRPIATGYGRILRDERGHVIGVVEQKDASADELAITEINAGIYCGPADFFREAVLGLGTGNAQGEYYLTDVVARAAETIGVSAVEADVRRRRPASTIAQQLAEAETTLRGAHQPRAAWRTSPSAIPTSTSSSPASRSASTSSWGATWRCAAGRAIGHGARIDDGCILTDTEVGAGAQIKPYSDRDRGRDRPGRDHRAVRAHAAGHPARPGRARRQLRRDQEDRHRPRQQGQPPQYLGDTTIGEKVNVGAGTITCNYDGYKKFQTVIEDGAFIGSDSQLIAPVRMGKRAVVGAGTTVTRDVPAGRAGARRGAADREARATPTRSPSATPGSRSGARKAAARRGRAQGRQDDRRAAKPSAGKREAPKPRAGVKTAPGRAKRGEDGAKAKDAGRSKSARSAAVTSGSPRRRSCDGARVGLTPTGGASMMSVGGPDADVGKDVLRRESAGGAQHQPGEGEGRGRRVSVQDHRRRRRNLDGRPGVDAADRASRASTGRPSARSRRATPTSATWSTAACRRRCRCSSAASSRSAAIRCWRPS